MRENTAAVLRLGARNGMCVLGGTGPNQSILPSTALLRGSLLFLPWELQLVHTYLTNKLEFNPSIEGKSIYLSQVCPRCWCWRGAGSLGQLERWWDNFQAAINADQH